MGNAILMQTWAFGNMPNVCLASLTPYGLGMMKAMAMGELRVVVIELSDFFKAVTKMDGGSPIKFDALKSKVLGLDAEKLGKLCSSSDEPLNVFVCTLKPYEILYVPAGFIVAEHASDGSTLIYGARKSVVVASAAGCKDFEAVIDLYKVSGKETAKMEAILAKMKPEQSSPKKS